MKKSEIYNLAQHAVLKDPNLTHSSKLKIIRELQEREDLALHVEKREAEEKQTESGDEDVVCS